DRPVVLDHPDVAQLVCGARERVALEERRRVRQAPDLAIVEHRGAVVPDELIAERRGEDREAGRGGEQRGARAGEGSTTGASGHVPLSWFEVRIKRGQGRGPAA